MLTTIANAKSRPKTQFDRMIISWQGWQFWNQTFDPEDPEWKFDVEEIREILDEETTT